MSRGGAPPRIEVGGLLGGRFLIQRLVAEGGMGAVYRAVDRASGDLVAVKIQRHPDRRRFAREAGLLATLDHPAIVRCLGHGLEDDVAYLVEAWIAGPTLREVLTASGLTPAESVTLAHRLALALGAAHRRGILHRDLKPENVLLEGGAVEGARLVDFGAARRFDGRGRLTRTGVAVGTPGYMSLEQARGDPSVDPRTDVYALGCLLFECLTGRIAFAGTNGLAVRTKVLFLEPPDPQPLAPELPAPWIDLLRRLMARRREERPSDGDAAAQALAALPPFADPRRRPLAEAAPPTVVEPDLEGLALGLLGGVAERDPAALAAILAPLPPLVEHCTVEGGTLILRHFARRAEVAAAGVASCLLELAPRLQGCRSALVAGPAACLDQLLDRGARLLERAAIREAAAQALGLPTAPGVAVDRATAELLGEGFSVGRSAHGRTLLGPRR